MATRATVVSQGIGLCISLVCGGAALDGQQFSARSGSTVTLGARVQVQYEASSETDVPATFFLRRAWVTIDGKLNDLVGGRVQFNAHGSSVLEAYLQLTPSPAFQVQIGQFKRAMSYYWLAANSDLPLIERNGRVTGVDHCPGVGGVCSFGQFTGALGLDNYEPGILMTGRFAGRMGYRFTLTNGEGLGKKDVNTRKSASGRLSMYFAENSRLSAYVAMDETLDSRGETMGVPAYGGELEVGTWRQGPHLLVNALQGRNWKLNDDATFSAFQVMGLWYRPLDPGSGLAAIEPLLRVSWANTESDDPGSITGTVITPGVMVYAAGRNGISANLDLYRSDGRSDWSLKIQAFTFF
jgi:hypothetical protein